MKISVAVLFLIVLFGCLFLFALHVLRAGLQMRHVATFVGN